MTAAIDVLQAPAALKLDLACGQNCQDGFEGVDIVPCKGVQHVQNLWVFPWKWPDASVDEIVCRHHVEHIPMVYVAPDGVTHRAVPADAGDRDLFLAFFDECWRILKPGGKMYVSCPAARHNRAFQDPTHRRFLVQESFLYLNKKWRKSAGVDHYNVACDFDVSADPILPESEKQYSRLAREQRFHTKWNVVLDWAVHLTKPAKDEKPLPTTLAERYDGATFARA